MPYACVAATKEGARCRNFVERPGEMCRLHQEEEGVESAPRPDVILVKFNINPTWSEKFEVLGIPRKSLLSMEKESVHVRQAEKFGRQPYRFRQIADSGVPVFGTQGVSDVSLFETLKELLEEYNITDIHLRPRRDEKMDVLVISLSREGTETILSSTATMELLKFLAVSCWGYCHIWANPPDEKGKVVHTVNSSHRQPDKQARWSLCFNGGLWKTEPT